MQVNAIGILSRTYGPDIAWDELKALLYQADHLVALDLAGDEANYPGGLFVEHIERARDSGLQVTAHAGEAAGPDSIWQAIRELGATRIGHAVHATDDPRLMNYIRENRVGVEANLTSNVQTSTVRDYASHPLANFLDHGILATINTDNPGISRISLPYEYEIAAPAAGLSREQTRRAQRNALEIAFLSTEAKERLLAGKAEE
jgi:adenosine deaminase